MAESKTTKKEPARKASAPEGLDGLAELQAQADKDAARGCIGEPVDPLPNSAHSLESGPDAPSGAEQLAALNKENSK